MIVSECKYTSDSYFGYSTELKKKFTYIHLVSIFQQQGPPISRNCKNSITGGQVHYGGRCAFLHYPPYHRQGMSVNSLPRIPDIPLLLGYLVVKGDNGAPIMKKTLSRSKDQKLICIFMIIQKYNFNFCNLLT